MQTYRSWTYDGYNNLYNSIGLAASGLTTCFGTVVLLNDQFFDARNVTKSDGHRMDTFDAGQYGALGVANRGFIAAHRAPARVMNCGTDSWATPFDLSEVEVENLPAVDIINGHIESTSAPLLGAIESGAEGIVTSGHGPGGLSYLQSDARDAAIEAGMVIVSATRTGGNGNFDSGGTTIGAFDLLPQKARILLQLSLAYSDDIEQVRSWFTTIGYANFDLSHALN